MKQTTANGIYFLTLMDDTNSRDFEDMIERSTAVYQSFDFAEKIEVIVFFDNRDAFSEYIGNAYGIKDEYSERGRGIHYPYGLKSIIGIHAVKGMTEGLLTHELGHAIEHFKLKADGDRYEAWKSRRGYVIWSEFFCQAHASYNRRELEEDNDVYLRTFIVHLDEKEERFSEEHMQETFLYLIYSMSDLFYYVQQDNQQAITYFLNGYQQFSNAAFVELYLEIYRELHDYLLKNGTSYEATHDYAFFEKLEEYEQKLTNFFRN